MADAKIDPQQVRWEAMCDPALTSDAVWKLNVYRAALYLLHVAGHDCEKLAGSTTASVADQLRRAVGSVSANLAEGYSRSGRADRLRFFDYALGSARECCTWYLATENTLGPNTLTSRLTLLSSIRAQLLGLIRSTRTRKGAPAFEK